MEALVVADCIASESNHPFHNTRILCFVSEQNINPKPSPTKRSFIACTMSRFRCSCQGSEQQLGVRQGKS